MAAQPRFTLSLAAALFMAFGALPAQVGAQSAAPAVAPAAASKAPAPTTPAKSDIKKRTTSLPAKGLFVGDKLSDSARARLADLIVDAIGLEVEIALVIPVGPWNLEGSGRDERDLTPARLQAVKRYLSERGVDPKRVFVESRIDPKLKEARLDVQTIARPAND